MARTWLQIEVELVAGRGEYLWPRPGRVLIAQRGWTFRMLADAINQAFGRWDLSHLHAFTMADGSRIGIADPWDEMGLEDDTRATLSRLSLGEAFAFTFDFGDDWDHICRVGPAKVDPEAVAGIVPTRPIPVFGWGQLPDQHGRSFSEDDGSDNNPPLEPDPPASDLPPLLADWGSQPSAPVFAASPSIAEGLAGLRPPMDWTRDAARDLRAAVHRGDMTTALGLLSAFDAADVAHLSSPVLEALAADPTRWPLDRDIVGWVVECLDERGFDGDADLVEVLTYRVPPDLAPVPVNAEDLALALTGSETAEFHQVLHRTTGVLTLVETGDELEKMLDDRELLHVVGFASRNDGWWDMAEFIERVEDGELADRLLSAINGKGAFRRFADLLHRPEHADVLTRWTLFRDERQLGRARSWLAAHGLRPTPPSPDRWT